jgi:hypothetical protein
MPLVTGTTDPGAILPVLLGANAMPGFDLTLLVLVSSPVTQDGRRGSEFLSYGVKHLKTWIVNDDEHWQGATASFGTDHIENVLSAAFVPALHYMAAPGDSCILTGFASGQVSK